MVNQLWQYCYKCRSRICHHHISNPQFIGINTYSGWLQQQSIQQNNGLTVVSEEISTISLSNNSISSPLSNQNKLLLLLET